MHIFQGCPLPTALFLFNSWIRDVTSKFNLCFNENVEGKNPCAFVTWTDWDLKVCLENECKRKGILKPKILNAWIDLVLRYFRMTFQQKISLFANLYLNFFLFAFNHCRNISTRSFTTESPKDSTGLLKKLV